MALEKKTIEIPLGGLDTKTSETLVKPGSQLELENFQFDEIGALVKRYGYAAISNAITGSVNIERGYAALTHNDQVLFCGAAEESDGDPTDTYGNRVFAYQPEDGSLKEVGRHMPIDFRVNDLSHADLRTNLDYAETVDGKWMAACSTLDRGGSTDRQVVFFEKATKT